MKNLFFINLILLFACGRKVENQNQLNTEYLDKEIASRALVLKNDSLFGKEITLIQKEVDNLKSLTIDIENIKASLVQSNRYFNSAAKQYGLDTSGFEILYKGVPLNDVVNIINKNHLSLLNKIIIKRNVADSLMFTAQ